MNVVGNPIIQDIRATRVPDIGEPDAYTVATRRAQPLLTITLAELFDETGDGPLWLIDGILPTSSVIVLGGEPKTGKTFLAMNFALAVANEGREEILGRSIHAHGPVLFIEEEGTRPALRERFKKMSEAGAFDPSSNSLRLALHQGAGIDQPQGIEALRATLKETQPRLVILDPLSFLHTRDEDKAGQMTGPFRELGRLAREFDTAILLIHHTKKPQPMAQRGSAGMQLRGSSAIAAATDANLILRKRGQMLSLEGDLRDGARLSIELSFDWTTYLVTPAEILPPGFIAPDRYEALVKYVERTGKISITEATELLVLAPNTVRPLLDAAAKDGVLVKLREGRSDIWRLSVTPSAPY